MNRQQAPEAKHVLVRIVQRSVTIRTYQVEGRMKRKEKEKNVGPFLCRKERIGNQTHKGYLTYITLFDMFSTVRLFFYVVVMHIEWQSRAGVKAAIYYQTQHVRTKMAVCSRQRDGRHV